MFILYVLIFFVRKAVCVLFIINVYFVLQADDQMKFLHEQLQQPDYQEAIQNFNSPLNTANILGEIV